MQSWMPHVRVAVPSWLEARLYVAAAYVVTWAVIDRLEPPPDFSPIEDGLLAWDGSWYHQIAENGYADAADPAVRFFPLWPLLGRWVGLLFGGRSDIALVLLANGFALVAAVLLHRLVLEETGDARLARRSVRMLALFPAAFVLVLAYSEPLFLSLAIGLFLVLRHQRWAVAALLGYLAGLTRPVGSLLAVGVAVVVWRDQAWRRPGALAAIVAAPLGSATFVLWAHLALDDWRAPLDRQRELRGNATEPFTRWFSGIGDAVRGDEGEMLHVIAVAVLIGLTIVVVRRLPLEMTAFTVVSVIVLVSADNLNSMERYALATFPLIIAVAMISRRPIFDRWLPTASAVGLVSLTTLALNGVYVP